MDLFRVRLNCIDYYQATPSKLDPLLRNGVQPSQIQKEAKVPVIRVFGSTETGQKVCAHIHGAFPYLYIEYIGSLIPDEVGSYIHRLHLSIDYAMAVSYRRNPYDGKARFVARVTIVKGVPFYGFHVGYKYYIKIYMLNPIHMTRLGDLLRQGAIMKKTFQPYEAHLQYILQWMADYNLYGCGYIDCNKVSFRTPVPKYEEIGNLSHLWHDRSIPEEFMTKESELPKVSHCSVEVDICVQAIMNRHDIKPRPLHHDFIERLNPLPPSEKLVHSMAGLWKDETRRRRLKTSNNDPGSTPFPAEVMVSMSADPRNTQLGVWIHEEEYREKITDLIVDERKKSDGAKISFKTFVKTTPFDSTVKTTLESVEDLFPENLRPILGLTQRPEVNYDLNELNEKDVDEKQITSFGLDDNEEVFYDSDEEVMREMELSQRKKGDHIEEQHVNPDNNSDVDVENDPQLPQDEALPLKVSKFGENLGGLEEFASSSLDSFKTVNENLQEIHDSGSLSNISAVGNKNSFAREPQEMHSSPPLGSLKRPQSPINHEDGYTKRQRISLGSSHGIQFSDCVQQQSSDSEVRLMRSTSQGPEIPKNIETSSGWRSSRDGSPVVTEEPRLRPEPSTRRPSQDYSKYGSQTQTQALRFPIVKDLHELSSMSQLSQKTASQTSSSGTKKRFASLDQSKQFPDSSGDTQVAYQLKTEDASSTIINVLSNMSALYPDADRGLVEAIREPPPSSASVVSSMQQFGLPQVIYQDAFYSKDADVPERSREWAGREFKLESLSAPFLPDFDPTGTSEATFGEKLGIVVDKPKEQKTYERRRKACTLQTWEIADPPPSYAEVKEWSRKGQKEESSAISQSSIGPGTKAQYKNRLSQIDGPTQKNKHGFKYTQNKATNTIQHEVQYMSTMSLEVHVNTRGNLVPNPEEDEIQCLFWCLQLDEPGLVSDGDAINTQLGIVTLSEDGIMAQKIGRQTAVEVLEEASELDLIVRMVELVRTYDPDILTGYEVHGGSWGYLIERARLKYEYNLCDEFSRMKSQSHGRFGKDNDKWGFNNTSTIRVTGRHMINIWRAMRGELNLLQYTMENVVFHLLHRRIPHYTWADLTKWYTNEKAGGLAKTIGYYLSRVQINLEILDRNELISRTSEQARLLGVDFFSVFSRGSQFKVESLMFRIAKPENFLLVSPNRKQVGGQNALECLPLVMEPHSSFYTSPLLVLDFQSLYPSVMIAYNYCYSTFLGRIVNWRGTNKMGFTEYKRQQRLLELMKDHINIAPNGIMYAKPEIRKSLLAKMLGEILETRVMVKSGMKVDKDDKALQRLLNNRQLALKLIANVTYGYTSASFSGRMPCSEIADSIVQTGRETLEKAIALIHSVKRWGAEVVYGDTDSIFVSLKGRTKDQAFDIGEEIARTVTNMNPRPIKLKFEKVYLPCVLLAKKRYVGFKYEHRDQVEPDFDAKGIETVRRDGTPAEQKIEEKALKILFRTSDLSQVKTYFQQQCEKIMKGSVSVQDFCFAKEVKLGTYSDKGPPPPGAVISTKRMLEDARAEPQYGERVPYVVITGAPGARLIDRCVAPEVLLENDHNDLDAEYYISKNLIPPLERIFNLVGANVRTWYDEMPKVQRIRKVDTHLNLLQGHHSKELVAVSKKTLESYMKSSSCLVCREKLETDYPICPNCLTDKPVSLLALRVRLNAVERKALDLQRVCQSCSGMSPVDEVRCDSQDCPVFYTRTKQKAHLKTERSVVEPVIRELSGNGASIADLEW